MRALRLPCVPFLGGAATAARAEDISGPISVTKVIMEDSQLVGDVTCSTASRLSASAVVTVTVPHDLR